MGRFDVFEVLRGLWCVRYPRSESCAYIIKTSPGAIVVDTGPAPSADGMMAGLQRARVGLTSIRALVLTDAHLEQSGGAQALRVRSGARLMCDPRSAAALDPPPSDDGNVGLSPDQILTPGDSLEGCLAVSRPPGGTNAPAWFYLSRDRALFTGRSEAQPDIYEADWILPARGAPRPRER